MQLIKDYTESAIFKIEIKMLSGKMFTLGTYRENCKVRDISYFLQETEFFDVNTNNIVLVRDGQDIPLPPYYLINSDMQLNIFIRNSFPELHEFCRDPQNILSLEHEVSYLINLGEPTSILEDFTDGWSEYVLYGNNIPENIDELRQIAIAVLSKYSMGYLIERLYSEEVVEDYPSEDEIHV